MRIKNWHKHQHFKDRKPPWIKLYREILDDIEWHELDAKAAKVLVMLWLIASEFDGELPELKRLAFRLRMSETETKTICSKLSHWLEDFDITTISERYQNDAPETEGEKEGETKKEPPSGALRFEDFWKAWPKNERKQDKAKCLAKWKSEKLDKVADTILSDVQVKQQTQKWQQGYIEAPLVYLNGKRWLDEVQPEAPRVQQDIARVTVPSKQGKDPVLEQIERDALMAVKPTQEQREQWANILKAKQ